MLKTSQMPTQVSLNVSLNVKNYFLLFEKTLIKTCPFECLIKIYIIRLSNNCFLNHLFLIEKLNFLFLNNLKNIYKEGFFVY